MVSDILRSIIQNYRPIVITFFLAICISALYAQQLEETDTSAVTDENVLTDVSDSIGGEIVYESVESPYLTVMTHLSNLQKESYRPNIAAMTIPGNNLKARRDIAIKIKKVLDYEGLYIDVENLPKDPAYRDTSTNKQRYILAEERPEIYLSLQDGKWLYSKETVKMIPVLFAEYEELEEYSLQEILGKDWTDEYFGLETWQWIWLGIFLVIAVLLYFILNLIFSKILIRLFNKFGRTNALAEYMEPVSRPLSIIAVLFLFSKALPLINLPIEYSATILYIIKVATPIILTYTVFKLTDLVGDIYSAFASRTATKIDDNLVPLVRRLLKGLVVIVGIFYVVDALGFDLAPLLAGVSIGGLAFALAAQDTVKNLLGSITIYIDQPFDLNDWIVFEGAEGIVEEVGIRSTRIRTFYNSVVSVPNGKIADGKIDNMGKRLYRRYKATISITYDTPPDLIESYVDGLRQVLLDMDVSLKDNYEIHLNEFADHSLDILVYVFFVVDNWTAELEARQEFILESLHLAKDLGVRFAFPTTTLHIEDFPGQEPKTPLYNETRDEFLRKVDKYMESRKSRKGNYLKPRKYRDGIEGSGGE
jgi:MscS family membrane protein